MAWKVVTKKPNVRLEYEELVRASENKWTNQIRRDIDRTFPQLPYFADSQSSLGLIGQAALFRTLCAYSDFNPRVGYCQGMNFLLALFLLVSGGREHEAFDMFVMITENSYSDHRELSLSGLEGLFQEQFPLLAEYKFYFFALFKRKLPKLSEHFAQLGVPDGLWIDKWFLTLFLYQLPLGLVIRVWDNLLAQGLVFMFQMALALLKFSEKELLSLDMVGVLEYIRGIGKRQDQAGLMQVGQGVLMPDGTFASPYQVLPNNVETIIRKANEIKISLAELQQIKLDFKAVQAANAVTTRKFNAFEKQQIDQIEEEKSEREEDHEEDEEEDHHPEGRPQPLEEEDSPSLLPPVHSHQHSVSETEEERELKEAIRPQRAESPDLAFHRGPPPGVVEFRSSIVKGVQEEAKISQQEREAEDEPMFKQSPQPRFNPRMLEEQVLQTNPTAPREQRKTPSDTPDQLSLSETQEHFNRTQSIANSYNYSLSKRSSSRGGIAFPGSNHPSQTLSKDNLGGLKGRAHEWQDLLGGGPGGGEDEFEKTGHIGSEQSSNASSEVPPEETWLQQSGGHHHGAHGQVPEDIQSEQTEQDPKTDRIRDLTEDAIEFVSASHGWGFLGEGPLSNFKTGKKEDSPLAALDFQASRSVHHLHLGGEGPGPQTNNFLS